MTTGIEGTSSMKMRRDLWSRLMNRATMWYS